jgi:phospholipase/carboxylesterase
MQTEKIAGYTTVVNKKSDDSRAIIMLHGYGANNLDLAGLSSMIDMGGTWFFPNGPIDLAFSPFYESRAWFPIDQKAMEEAMRSGGFRDFSKPASEPFIHALEAILPFIQEISARYKQVWIGGFSQGAMLASHLLAKFPKVFYGGILFSGVLVDRLLIEGYHPEKTQLNIFQSHGRSDQVLSFKGASELSLFFSEKAKNHYFMAFEGGHEIPPSVIVKLNTYLKNLN